MQKFSYLVLIAGLSFGLSACSSAKDKLGLNKQVPDEFMVVKNAPLSMPPDYSLMPPRPGAPRPQDVATSEAARTVVFGEEAPTQPQQPTTSNAESLLLQQAGTNEANTNIRRIVDAESAEIKRENQTVIEKLTGSGGDGPGATVVNAKEEAQRLKKNSVEGKPVTAGETPSIEQ